MFKYLKDVLSTLKDINNNLTKINISTSLSQENTKALSDCVKVDHHRHGDHKSISTKHWND